MVSLDGLLSLFCAFSLACIPGVSADVHTIRYATYDTSSPLGPWAPATLNEDWAAQGNVSAPVWCLQNNPITQEAVDGQVGQAEDCLLLRIFRPDNFTTSTTNSTKSSSANSTESSPTELVPVMIWIHGGMYLLGSGASEDLYHGGFLADREGIIVVSINYRLGAHGFLGYDGTYGSAINSGALDQKVAIEWTSRYIEEFGGDPSRITLAGESAGATSVNIHMANVDTNRLLDKAILESNPAGINLKPSGDQQELFRKLAGKVGCDGDTDNDMMDCLVLQSQTPEGMANIIRESSKVNYINSLSHLDVWMTFYSWAPSVDGVYIFGQPNKVAVDTWPEEKPVLIGTNEEEARFFLDMICSILTAIADQVPFGHAIIHCDGGDLYDRTLYRDMVLLAYGLDTFEIDNYYKYQWRPDEDTDTAPEQFALLVTDSVFNCPNYDMARGVSAGKTYFYRYAVDAICSVASSSEDCEGFSCHGDEIATVFGTYGVPAVSEIGSCTPEKVAMLQPYVKMIQTQWGNFVRDGRPSDVTDWGATADETGPLFFFEQAYENEENGDRVRVPFMYESSFNTHHMEQSRHSAQEVCETWAKHTYKSESESGAATYALGSLVFLANAVLLSGVFVSALV